MHARRTARRKYRRLAEAARRSWQHDPRHPVRRGQLLRLLRRMGWSEREVQALETQGLLAPLGFLLVGRGVLAPVERTRTNTNHS